MFIVDQLHWTTGLATVADAFAGTVNTDIVNCRSAVGVLFLIHKAVGATGTSTITVRACDDVTPSNDAAVEFMYRACTTLDTWGDWTQAGVAGFATTAGSNQLYQVFVPAAEIAAQGYGYVRLRAVELVDNPVLGGIEIAVVQPRYQPVSSTLLT